MNDTVKIPKTPDPVRFLVNEDGLIMLVPRARPQYPTPFSAFAAQRRGGWRDRLAAWIDRWFDPSW